MLPFRSVLFPVDYSPACDAVVPYVTDIVRHYNAALTLVHAYGPQPIFADELVPDPLAWPHRIESHEAFQLRQFAERAFPGLKLELRAELGEPGAVIQQVREREGTDLIMMPTRGQGPVRRLLLGSVTAKVLHDSSAAVWTGTGAAVAGHMAAPHYRSILCALDDSEEAEAVLRAASNLAHSYHAKLYLIHVVPMIPAAPNMDFTVYRKELLEAAEANLHALKERLGVDAPQLITDSVLVDAIVKEALHRKADLLVVGRGESQRMGAAFWSVLYPLIREAPCPVLSV
jgi:nucleotide-binding universal stress UspA family protein